MLTDPRGLQHLLGIETVRWSAGTGTDIVVRVAGRWRRRRPAATVSPVLVIDTEHQRHRFPALPELPSGLDGGGQPAVWQVSFVIPASLAPFLSGRLALALGSVIIPLPPPTRGSDELPVPARNGASHSNGSEPAESAELVAARREGERLRAAVAFSQNKRREAEQLAHSETALRREFERDQARRLQRHQAQARAVLELLEATRLRVRQLECEVETLRRAADEVVHPLTNAPVVEDPAVGGLRSELDQERSVRAQLEAERVEDRERAAFVTDAIEDLARRLDALRVAAAAAPPAAPAVDAREPPLQVSSGDGADQPADPAGAVVPDRLAAALYRLREASPQLEVEPEVAVDAEIEVEVAVDAEVAVAVDAEVDASVDAGVEPDGIAGSEVVPESAAQPEPAAVSESAAAPESDAPAVGLPSGLFAASPTVSAQAPGVPTARWLQPTMRRLLGDDPTVAGKVVLHLLPAHKLVAGPVRYDLVVGPTCLAVTVREDRVHFDILAEPRPLSQIDFRIEGDLAGLGRLLVYGAVRRRVSRRVARVRGDRGAANALTALMRKPLSLGELNAAGVRLDPELTLRLIAGMIDPSWTAGERFTVGHESRGGASREYLLVRDGARPCVSQRPPLGPVATTILCPDEELFPLLAGGSAPEAAVLGKAEPVAQLRAWIARAERAA